MIMTKLIINVGGDSGGGGGGAELVDGGMSPWAGYCHCFFHLAHDVVQVPFLHLHQLYLFSCRYSATFQPVGPRTKRLHVS